MATPPPSLITPSEPGSSLPPSSEKSAQPKLWLWILLALLALGGGQGSLGC